jgi:hypothetical protein
LGGKYVVRAEQLNLKNGKKCNTDDTADGEGNSKATGVADDTAVGEGNSKRKGKGKNKSKGKGKGNGNGRGKGKGKGNSENQSGDAAKNGAEVGKVKKRPAANKKAVDGAGVGEIDDEVDAAGMEVLQTPPAKRSLAPDAEQTSGEKAPKKPRVAPKEAAPMKAIPKVAPKAAAPMKAIPKASPKAAQEDGEAEPKVIFAGRYRPEGLLPALRFDVISEVFFSTVDSMVKPKSKAQAWVCNTLLVIAAAG